MAAQTTQTDKVLELVRKEGVLRPRDLDPYNIPRTYLSRLCVDLHRKLSQKQYMFASEIDPAAAV